MIIILLLSIKFIWEQWTEMRRHASAKINGNIKKCITAAVQRVSRNEIFYADRSRARVVFAGRLGRGPSNRRPATAVVVPTSLSVGLSVRPGRTSVRMFFNIVFVHSVFVNQLSNASCRKCLLKYILKGPIIHWWSLLRKNSDFVIRWTEFHRFFVPQVSVHW